MARSPERPARRRRRRAGAAVVSLAAPQAERARARAAMPGTTAAAERSANHFVSPESSVDCRLTIAKLGSRRWTDSGAVGERRVNSTAQSGTRTAARRTSRERPGDCAGACPRRVSADLVHLGRDDPALAHVRDQQAAGLQLRVRHAERVEHASAAPGGGCTARRPRRPATQVVDQRPAPPVAVASSSLSPSSSSSFQPVVSAYGATVSTQRVLLELTTRVTSYAASTGTSRWACCRPAWSSGRSRSSWRRQRLAGAGLAVAEHDERVGTPPQRRAPRAACPGRGRSSAGRAPRRTAPSATSSISSLGR